MRRSRERERITLARVAQDAHVSRATASLVLRDSPLVADETRRKVHDSMQRLGYVYHRAAASLRTRRSQTVGLVITDITNPFFAELTVGIEERLDRARHVVVLGNTAESAIKQERLLAAMNEYNADGVLICPAEETAAESIEALRRWRLPFVMVVRYLAGVSGDYVGADNAAGAMLAVEHLITHGHRRIAFVGGSPHSSARRDRLAGYRGALARHGLDADESLTPASAPTREGGFSAMQRLLERADPPTAALCYNDVVAFGVVLGLRAAGYEPGRDMAVIGFDDLAEAALWRPALSSVAIEPHRIGEEAAALLLERIADPDGTPRRIVVPPHLVIRESCGSHDCREGLS